MIKAKFRRVYRRILPVPARQWLVRNFRYPYAGKVDFGDLKRTKPISQVWGLDRGMPVDRYYIGCFLSRYASAVRGHALEIGENRYTLQHGGEQVTKSDILHVAEGFPSATIIADLTRAEHIPSDTFDCIICTQTLHLIFEVDQAIGTLYRILKPGGLSW
jgi:SAM-dependent methyltransferase